MPRTSGISEDQHKSYESRVQYDASGISPEPRDEIKYSESRLEKDIPGKPDHFRDKSVFVHCNSSLTDNIPGTSDNLRGNHKYNESQSEDDKSDVSVSSIGIHRRISYESRLEDDISKQHDNLIDKSVHCNSSVTDNIPGTSDSFRSNHKSNEPQYEGDKSDVSVNSVGIHRLISYESRLEEDISGKPPKPRGESKYRESFLEKDISEQLGNFKGTSKYYKFRLTNDNYPEGIMVGGEVTRERIV